MRIQFVQDIIDKIRGKKNLKSNNVKYGRMIFSQDGEDAVLYSLITENKGFNNKGFYIDIGAHHPFRFSNTCIFYNIGWRGVNIDGTPNSMQEFQKYRPNDINIEAVISNKEEDVQYYSFMEPALNCFDKTVAEERIAKGCELKETINLKTKNINDILDTYVPIGQTIDFINIDIEGVDYDVICSLNYEKYAPKYFIIEELDYVNKDFVDYQNSRMYQFLSDKGYKVLGKTMRSVIYGK